MIGKLKEFANIPLGKLANPMCLCEIVKPKFNVV